MEESGPEPRDEEDRRTSRLTRRGHRRLKRRPSHLTPGENPAKVEELSTSATPEGRGGRRRAPDRLSSSLADDRDAPGRGKRSKSQEELPVCAPPSACLETGRRSVSSVIPRRICGRATEPPPTTRRANRRRRPSSGAL